MFNYVLSLSSNVNIVHIVHTVHNVKLCSQCKRNVNSKNGMVTLWKWFEQSLEGFGFGFGFGCCPVRDLAQPGGSPLGIRVSCHHHIFHRRSDPRNFTRENLIGNEIRQKHATLGEKKRC